MQLFELIFLHCYKNSEFLFSPLETKIIIKISSHLDIQEPLTNIHVDGAKKNQKFIPSGIAEKLSCGVYQQQIP